MPFWWEKISASWLPSQEWVWDEVPDATSYRLYWSAAADDWWACQVREYPASECVGGVCSEVDGIQHPPGTLIFFVVTAVGTRPESDTEHGEVRPCP